jgi:hypothetical protein
MPVVWLDAELAAQVRLLLLDPMTGKMRWGGWRGLITRLLRDWIEKQKLDPSEANDLSRQSYATTRSQDAQSQS